MDRAGAVGAGGRANLLLAKMIETDLGGTVTVRNESMTIKGDAALSSARLRDYLFELRASGRPDEPDAARFAPLAARVRLSKFEPCLPEAVLSALQARLVVDRDSAIRVLSLLR